MEREMGERAGAGAKSAARKAREAAITRLLGGCLREPSDEWAVQRARAMTRVTVAPRADDLDVTLAVFAG